MKLRMTFVALAAIVMGAHFLRFGNYLPLLVCLAIPFVLLAKKRWSLRIIQALTVVAAGIWLWVLNGIIQERLLEGRSWIASGVILGAVAGFNLLTGYLLESPVVKDHFND